MEGLQQDETARNTAAATLTSTEANVKTATLNVEWTKVKAPIDFVLGIIPTTLVSAFTEGDYEKRALESQVAKVTGKKIRATYSTDKSILGGSVVKVGSTVYDGSVRGQLQRLKQQLIEA